MGRKSGGGDYRVLYWMGAGLALLLAGVVGLYLLMPDPGPPPDPERTLVWLTSPTGDATLASAAIIEESRSRGSLTALPFLVPPPLSEAYSSQGVAKTRELLAAEVGLKVHRHLVLTSGVLVTLTQKVGGITVLGQALDGPMAVAYIQEGGEFRSQRMAHVLLALAESAAEGGVPMSTREGLALVNQLETNYDPADIPNVLARWRSYGHPLILAQGPSLGVLRGWLRPDPPPQPVEAAK